jgi:predicted PurR-regulated permease PerM
MTDPEQPTGSSKGWRDLHLWQIQPLRDLLVAFLIFGFFWLGNVLSLVTVPLLLAILIAYLVEPIVALVTRKTSFSRQTIAAALIVVVALVVVVPTVIGLALGITQGIQTVGSIRVDVERVIVSIENPGDEQAEQAVPRQWQWLTEQIAEEIEASRKRSESVPGLEGQSERQPDTRTDTQTDNQDQAPPEDRPESVSVPIDNSSGEPENSAHDFDKNIPAGTPGPNAPPPTEGVLNTQYGEYEPPQSVALVRRILSWTRDNADAIASQAFQTGRDAISATIGFLAGATKLAFAAFLTAFFFFFICVRWNQVLTFGSKLIPLENRDRAHELIRQFDCVVAGFIRGRLTIAFIQSIIFALLYWLIGTPAPLLFGILIGVLSIVPYLAIIGIPATIIAMWLDPSDGLRGAWWWIVFMPIVVYNIGQAVDDYFLTPTIQGKSTNLDIPTILFASLAGGILFGIYGLLIAIPLAACIKIALRELFWPRFKAWVEGRETDFLPIDNK